MLYPPPTDKEIEIMAWVNTLRFGGAVHLEEEVVREIRKAVTAERERCAKLAEGYEPNDCECEICEESGGTHIDYNTPELIAAAIRKP
jgi:DNA-binding transcriptional MocR family regulator